MTQYVQAKVETLERPVTSWALLGIIIGLVVAYGFLINATIGNIVASKDIQSKTIALTASVSGLESRYLAAESAITSTDVLALGFVAPSSDPVYVSRANVGSLSFNR